ncbi:hypothetical protein M1K46_19625 [Fictibacillus sp. WQ 8-8]|uniref:hypothetical protein n=1 Tax=Fictibacillus sp. WQ 8-8 TaxID=2938788 RepID=UPI00210D00E5|nr:hypothetical protein [Fictibacillus sp. WQ 8-8]MCQ6267841.1 hypothetical protein [Fictibacillus sp. WQ 8-8]
MGSLIQTKRLQWSCSHCNLFTSHKFIVVAVIAEHIVAQAVGFAPTAVLHFVLFVLSFVMAFPFEFHFVLELAATVG